MPSLKSHWATKAYDKVFLQKTIPMPTYVSKANVEVPVLFQSLSSLRPSLRPLGVAAARLICLEQLGSPVVPFAMCCYGFPYKSSQRKTSVPLLWYGMVTGLPRQPWLKWANSCACRRTSKFERDRKGHRRRIEEDKSNTWFHWMSSAVRTGSMDMIRSIHGCVTEKMSTLHGLGIMSYRVSKALKFR